MDPAPFALHDVTEKREDATGLTRKTLIVIIRVVIFTLVMIIFGRQFHLT